MTKEIEIYDNYWEKFIKVNIPITLGEFKISQNKKTSIWGHPSNKFYKQTYKLLVYTPSQKGPNLNTYWNDEQIIPFNGKDRFELILTPTR